MPKNYKRFFVTQENEHFIETIKLQFGISTSAAINIIIDHIRLEGKIDLFLKGVKDDE